LEKEEEEKHILDVDAVEDMPIILGRNIAPHVDLGDQKE